VITRFLLVIGHGRALELYLSTFKIALGSWIIVENAGAAVPAFSDLAWHYPSVLLATPFFVVGGLQLIGWLLNWLGYEINWVFRFVGAMLAIWLWLWLVLKIEYAGEKSPLFVVALVAVPFSAILLYKAWNRLPVPGAPGLT
jgi:hypothetical protein